MDDDDCLDAFCCCLIFNPFGLFSNNDNRQSHYQEQYDEKHPYDCGCPYCCGY